MGSGISGALGGGSFRLSNAGLWLDAAGTCTMEDGAWAAATGGAGVVGCGGAGDGNCLGAGLGFCGSGLGRTGSGKGGNGCAGTGAEARDCGACKRTSILRFSGSEPGVSGLSTSGSTNSKSSTWNNNDIANAIAKLRLMRNSQYCASGRIDNNKGLIELSLFLDIRQRARYCDICSQPAKADH